MELKTSKDRATTEENFFEDEDMLDGLVDENGNSLAHSPVKEISPVKKPISRTSKVKKFEAKEYEVNQMRVYLVDKVLLQNKSNDLISFELQRGNDSDRQKIFYSASLDTFYQL